MVVSPKVPPTNYRIVDLKIGLYSTYLKFLDSRLTNPEAKIIFF